MFYIEFFHLSIPFQTITTSFLPTLSTTYFTKRRTRRVYRYQPPSPVDRSRLNPQLSARTPLPPSIQQVSDHYYLVITLFSSFQLPVYNYTSAHIIYRQHGRLRKCTCRWRRSRFVATGYTGNDVKVCQHLLYHFHRSTHDCWTLLWISTLYWSHTTSFISSQPFSFSMSFISLFGTFRVQHCLSMALLRDSLTWMSSGCAMAISGTLARSLAYTSSSQHTVACYDNIKLNFIAYYHI